MKLPVKILFIFLALIYGALFIYSAYTKAFPIQSFEYTLVEFLYMPWSVAAVASRFFIGLETGLGVLIASSVFGQSKWVLKLSSLILLIFTGYLIYLWVWYGNDVNCGCFGDAILMSPAASLAKNAVLLILTFVILRYYDGLSFKRAQTSSLVVLLIAVASPFFVLSIPPDQPNWLRNNGYMLNLSPLYAKEHSPVAVDLRKGKYVVAYLSQSCQHCRLAAYKMHLMKQANRDLPFFMIIGGTTSDLTEFWKATQASNIPYTRLEKADFLRSTGGVFPLIVFVNDSKVEAKAEYINLNQKVIEDWLRK